MLFYIKKYQTVLAPVERHWIQKIKVQYTKYSLLLKNCVTKIHPVSKRNNRFELITNIRFPDELFLEEIKFRKRLPQGPFRVGCMQGKRQILRWRKSKLSEGFYTVRKCIILLTYFKVQCKIEKWEMRNCKLQYFNKISRSKEKHRK